jgi:DNA-binding response OmpR family regulator
MTRILVVDDDTAILRNLGNHLEQQAWEVVVAADFASGEHAIVDEASWDALVLDKFLPGGSGLELLRISREKRGAVPAVVISADFDEETARDAAALGAAYLPKPFKMHQLDGFLRHAAAVSRDMELDSHSLAERTNADDGDERELGQAPDLPPCSCAASLEHRVDAMLMQLDARYELGQLAHSARYSVARVRETALSLRVLSRDAQLDPAALRRMARVTEIIRRPEFEQLKLLRTSRGLPLSWSCFEELATIRDPKLRRELAVAAADGALSIRTLRKRITAAVGDMARGSRRVRCSRGPRVDREVRE